MPNVPTILHQHGVHFSAGPDRDVGPGWIGMSCPFCTGSPGLHLGYNLTEHYFRCWRCGWHSPVDAIEALCRVTKGRAIELWRSAASGGPNSRSTERDRKAQARVKIGPYKRPSGVVPMEAHHRNYLTGRGFDPDRIAAVWGVEGTGPASYLDRIEYRHRLFIPIVWEGREVSFQTRDITGKSDLKYKACVEAREAVHHKDIVYAHPDGFRQSVGIAVEGVTDTWRLGTSALATFGIQLKVRQVLAIATRWKRVAIVFDPERAAQAQARRLAARLRAVGVDATIIEPPNGTDPGDMPDDDARHLVREVRRWGISA